MPTHDSFPEFIVKQLTNTRDDFVEKSKDKLLLTKEPSDSVNDRLVVLLDDKVSAPKRRGDIIKNNQGEDSDKAPFFYYLLRTYEWKDDIRDELDSKRFGNLKKLLQEDIGAIQPERLIARRIKASNEFKNILKENSELSEERRQKLESLAKEIVNGWGRIKLREPYYERLKGEEEKKEEKPDGPKEEKKVKEKKKPNDSELIASRSKLYAHLEPGSKFIYDSRVAMALFFLALLWEKKNPDFFPLVVGRSKAYKQITELFKNERKRSLERAKTFYNDYCDLIVLVRQKLLDELKIKDKLNQPEQEIFGQLVEMALFSLGRKIGSVRRR